MFLEFDPYTSLQHFMIFLCRTNQETHVCQGVAIPSLTLTTPPLTYASTAEMCYRGKSANSKYFAPEIRGITAQILPNSVNNNKRMGSHMYVSKTKPTQPIAAPIGLVNLYLHFLCPTALAAQKDGENKVFYNNYVFFNITY